MAFVTKLSCVLQDIIAILTRIEKAMESVGEEASLEEIGGVLRIRAEGIEQIVKYQAAVDAQYYGLRWKEPQDNPTLHTLYTEIEAKLEILQRYDAELIGNLRQRMRDIQQQLSLIARSRDVASSYVVQAAAYCGGA